MKNQKITVEGVDIKIFSYQDRDFISLTDIAKQVSARTDNVIGNWFRSPSALDFLQEWEMMYNESFNQEAFAEIRQQVGKPTFGMSAKEWVTVTGAIGVTAKAGRYGGTYAHKEIAFEFCTAISTKFKLYLIQEFDRLKEDESARLGLQRDVRRELAAANWHIQAKAVRENRVPVLDWNTKNEAPYHIVEADLLNKIVFGISSKLWKTANPEKSGNMRDHATKLELMILSNLEAINAVLIEDGLSLKKREARLTKVAAAEMEALMGTKAVKRIERMK